MSNFITGIIFGIIIATVGFGGIAKMIDKGVEQTKAIAIEGVK